MSYIPCRWPYEVLEGTAAPGGGIHLTVHVQVKFTTRGKSHVTSNKVQRGQAGTYIRSKLGKKITLFTLFLSSGHFMRISESLNAAHLVATNLCQSAICDLADLFRHYCSHKLVPARFFGRHSITPDGLG
jgi:hypothetical protein